MTTLTNNATVILQTETGNIQGLVSFNHTGNQTKLVMIEFIYDNQSYKLPFSRKTGKLYNYSLPFKIKLVL
jgi:hypothetical protein